MAGQPSSSNPVFTRAPSLQPQSFGAPGFPSAGQVEDIYRTPQRLTMDDIVVKTGLLLAIIVVTGGFAWITEPSFGVVIGAALGAFVLGLVNSFKRVVSPPLVIAYAALEGVFIGAVSSVYEAQYNGIVLQAAVATATMFAGMLALYKTGVIRATPRVTKMIFAGLIGVMGLMLVNGLINIFDGADSGLGLRAGGGIAVVFSLVCIAVAAFSFVLDFDAAERFVAAGVEERESWRVAFGLVVTLVWLYLEILRLLSYFRDE